VRLCRDLGIKDKVSDYAVLLNKAERARELYLAQEKQRSENSAAGGGGEYNEVNEQSPDRRPQVVCSAALQCALSVPVSPKDVSNADCTVE
jgi:hypothetical protein